MDTGFLYWYVLADGTVTTDIGRAWIGPERKEGTHRVLGIVQAKTLHKAVKKADRLGLRPYHHNTSKPITQKGNEQ